MSDSLPVHGILQARILEWVHFSSVQLLSPVWLFATPWIAAPQASLSGVHSNSHPLSQWCHPAISSSVVPFSSCPQTLPASESFPMSQLFAWGGQSIRVSALASVLPKNTQGWSPLEWTGWISLQSKGLSRVFSSITAQKHQFFGTQLSSQSNSHIYHQLPTTQTHVHWVGDAIQPSHPLLSPSPPTLNLSQDESLLKWISSSHQVAKVLEFQLQHQSHQWIFRMDFL